MSHIKNKVRWCLNKAEKEIKEGKKHRGLVEIKPDKEKANEHISKAVHNLKATLYLYEGNFTDWCSSSLFYTIYHCLLAILAKYGYESRNQECTFAFIESLIEDNKIQISKDEIEKITSLNVEDKHHESTVVSLREEYQYSTKVSLGNKEYEELLNLAKRILDKTKEIIAE